MDEGLKTATALFAGIGSGIAIGLSVAAKNRDEAERQRAIHTIKTNITKQYPKELAQRIIAKFTASGYDAAFDFDGEIRHYYEVKLYNFLLGSFSEEFADKLFERKRKFMMYEVPTSIEDLCRRTAATFPELGVVPENVPDSFAIWMEERSKPAPLSDAKTLETNLAALAAANIFKTDMGTAVILPDYRVFHVTPGQTFAYKELADFQEAHPKNRRWDMLLGEKRSVELASAQQELLDAMTLR